MVIESDSEESISGLERGTRFFVIRLYDGTVGEAAAATSISPDDLDRVEELCVETGVPFSQGVARAAIVHLSHRLWGTPIPPEDTEVQDITEVSRTELISLMRRSRERVTEGQAS